MGKIENEKMSFRALNNAGEETEFEILFSFESDEKEKKYIVYTDNSTDEDGRINVYASACNLKGDQSKYLPITEEKEWMMIEALLVGLQDQAD